MRLLTSVYSARAIASAAVQVHSFVLLLVVPLAWFYVRVPGPFIVTSW